MEATDDALVWVIDAADTELDRSERMARAFERHGGEVRPIGSRWCVVLPEGLDADRWRRRVERRLGRSVEERANCDVAWFPLGTGYAAVLVELPATDFEEWLDGAGLPYREVRRPSGGDGPIRACVPLAALPSTVVFAEQARSAGYAVRAMYEVGGCYR